MIRRLLKQYSIPTPSRIMADLIALKLAQLPADPSAPYKANSHMFDMELRDGRKIEITVDSCYTGDGSSRSWGGGTLTEGLDRKPGPGWHHPIKVGLPGAPHYRSVELTHEEQTIISDQIDLWQERSLAARRLQVEAESQETALDIVERLV